MHHRAGLGGCVVAQFVELNAPSSTEIEPVCLVASEEYSFTRDHGLSRDPRMGQALDFGLLLRV